MDNQNRDNHLKWFILTLAALTHALAVAMPMMCLPVLFKEISDDLGLNLVQVGAIWGMSYMPGMFSGLIGGTIGDRFGTKRTLSVFCLLAGLAGAARGLSGGFVSLTASALLFGFLFPAIPTNVHKTCGIWFSSRRLGLANGVVSMGMALGFMAGSMVSATLLSPWLGGWRNVLFFYGAVSVVIGLLWSLTPNPPDHDKTSAGPARHIPISQTLTRVLRLRNVWLLGIALLGINGCVQGLLGYLPLYLRNLGWSGPAADSALGTFHGVSMVAVILIAIWSDRIGSRKAVLISAALMIIAGTGLLSFADGLLVWAAVIMAGVVRDGFMAVYMTMVIETEDVGAAYAGTAIGLTMIFSALGTITAAPLGNSLAGIAPGLPFIFWAVMAAVGLAVLSAVKETGGPKAR